ncbi:translocation/assembly module TamB domain-containing protein [Lautropia mirabilis]
MLLGNDNGVRSPSIAERLGLDVLNYGYASNTGVDSGIQESMTPKGLVGSSSSSNADATETGVVSLGKRINDRLFVSYEKGVRGVWNLLRIQYTLGKGYVLRAQTGSDNSLDVLRSRSFD